MTDTTKDRRARRRETDRAWRLANKAKLTAYQKAYQRAYRAKHKARLAEREKADRKANPGKDAARLKTYRDKNRAEHRAKALAWTHRRREALAGRPRPEKCEICGKDGRIVFDHCHERQRFRGWLCNRCNRVLGMVRDDIALLFRLAAYLAISCHRD